MNCEYVEDLLSPFLDEKLATTERQELACHLETCTQCNAILTDFRRFDSMLSHLPRISPNHSLRERIFSSLNYQKLTGTTHAAYSHIPLPTTQHQFTDDKHPYLIPLHNDHYTTPNKHNLPISREPAMPLKQPRHNQLRGWTHYTRLLIAFICLLTVGIGSFIAWNYTHQDSLLDLDTNEHTQIATSKLSPALPKGTRFIFSRNNALWSAASNSSTTVTRLTPANVIVAQNWSVRPPLSGQTAGDLLAYIDLQTARLHIIQSNSQHDIILPQPLLKQGIRPTTIWDTATGQTILNSMIWSGDGQMLTFVADPNGTGETGIYIYTVNTAQIFEIPLPQPGKVTHPIWSPDSNRIAFELLQAGQSEILDYNIQNHGLITIPTLPGTKTATDDQLLTLDWSANIALPTLTWSTGTPGHIHAIWSQRINSDQTTHPQSLTQGDYTQALYNRQATKNDGGWLLVTDEADNNSDIRLTDLQGVSTHLTQQKQVTEIQWATDGKYIAYLANLSAGLGTLHMLNVITENDSIVNSAVTNSPPPDWSLDSQRLVYSTGNRVLIATTKNPTTSISLALQGIPATFSWSPTHNNQLIVSTNDNPQGIYLVDIQQNTALQIDQISAKSPFFWTQIP